MRYFFILYWEECWSVFFILCSIFFYSSKLGMPCFFYLYLACSIWHTKSRRSIIQWTLAFYVLPLYLRLFAWKIHFANTSSLREKPATENGMLDFTMLLYYSSPARYTKNLKFSQQTQLSRVLLHIFEQEDEWEKTREKKSTVIACYWMFYCLYWIHS